MTSNCKKCAATLNANDKVKHAKPLVAIGLCKICYRKEQKRLNGKKYREENSERVQTFAKTWNEANKSKRKGYALKSNYGLTTEEFNRMLLDQDGTCAICERPEFMKDYRGKLRDLSVDHCHKTDKIRGLLCYDCNLLLGKAEDNIDRLKAAIVYLEKNLS